jgi:hypothetical protein
MASSGSRATVIIAAALLPIAITSLVHCSSGTALTNTSEGGSNEGGSADEGSADGSSPIDLGVPRSHRVSATTCTVPRASSVNTDGGASNPFAACHSDAECTMGTNGRCRGVYNSEACACNYDACTSDADCSSGGVCLCRTAADTLARNRCLPRGDCLVDADCGATRYCSPSMLLGDTCDVQNIAYYCHTPGDECVDDFQCSQGYCLFDPSKKHWRCNEYPGCDGGVIFCGGR